MVLGPGGSSGVLTMSVVVLTFALLAPGALAQEVQPVETAPLAARWDPEVRRGMLDNGLSWFVRRNANPPHRAFARLQLRAGSLVEEDDERGLAHFCEHMAFNGSAHFASGAIAKLFEARGLRAGAHLNGGTSRDEVRYSFELPLEAPGDLALVVQLLGDIAGQATLSDEEIEKERGVVLAEMRQKTGVSRRLDEAIRELGMGGSRQHARDPLGLPSVIAGASPDAIRAFYRRWYQPDLMGVVLVGDFDPDEAARLLRAELSTLPARQPRPAAPLYPLAPKVGVQVRVLSDQEMQSSGLMLGWTRGQGWLSASEPASDKRAATDQSRVYSADERQPWLCEQLALRVLDQRLRALVARPGSPLLDARAAWNELVRGLDALAVRARPAPGAMLEAARVLRNEVARLRVNGVSAEELETVRKAALADVEARASDPAGPGSQALVDSLADAFRNDGIVLTREDDARLSRAILERVTAENLRAAFDARVQEDHRFALAFGPPGYAPIEAALRAAMLAEASPGDVPSPPAPGSLDVVPDPPPPGRVLSRHAIPEIGAEVLQLSNGLRLVVKPTDFQAGEILVGGLHVTRTLDLPRRDAAAAELATRVWNESGTADHPAEALDALLAGHGAEAHVLLRNEVTVLQAATRSGGLEVLAPLVHARLARPAFRPELLERFRQLAIGRWRDGGVSLEGAVMRAANETLTPGDGRLLDANDEELEAVTLADVERAWKRGVGDVSSWTLFIVGDVKLDAAIPLVERWLASIPTSGRPEPRARLEDMERWERFAVPLADVTVRLRVGEADRSLTLVRAAFRQGRGPVDRDAMNDLRLVLERRLMGRLREQLGATYSVQCGVQDLQPHPTLGALVVLFDSAPAERARLAAIAKGELRRLVTDSASDEEIEALRQARRREWAEDSRSNAAWLGALHDSCLRGRDWSAILDRPQEIERVSAASLRRAAQRWLNCDHLTEIFTVPAR